MAEGPSGRGTPASLDRTAGSEVEGCSAIQPGINTGGVEVDGAHGGNPSSNNHFTECPETTLDMSGLGLRNIVPSRGIEVPQNAEYPEGWSVWVTPTSQPLFHSAHNPGEDTASRRYFHPLFARQDDMDSMGGLESGLKIMGGVVISGKQLQSPEARDTFHDVQNFENAWQMHAYKGYPYAYSKEYAPSGNPPFDGPVSARLNREALEAQKATSAGAEKQAHQAQQAQQKTKAAMVNGDAYRLLGSIARTGNTVGTFRSMFPYRSENPDVTGSGYAQHQMYQTAGYLDYNRQQRRGLVTAPPGLGYNGPPGLEETSYDDWTMSAEECAMYALPPCNECCYQSTGFVGQNALGFQGTWDYQTPSGFQGASGYQQPSSSNYNQGSAGVSAAVAATGASAGTVQPAAFSSQGTTYYMYPPSSYSFGAFPLGPSAPDLAPIPGRSTTAHMRACLWCGNPVELDKFDEHRAKFCPMRDKNE